MVQVCVLHSTDESGERPRYRKSSNFGWWWTEVTLIFSCLGPTRRVRGPPRSVYGPTSTGTGDPEDEINSIPSSLYLAVPRSYDSCILRRVSILFFCHTSRPTSLLRRNRNQGFRSARGTKLRRRTSLWAVVVESSLSRGKGWQEDRRLLPVPLLSYTEIVESLSLSRHVSLKTCFPMFSLHRPVSEHVSLSSGIRTSETVRHLSPNDTYHH